MKPREPLFLKIILLSFLFVTRAYGAEAEKSQIVIYAYDSFLAKKGLGPQIFPLFEARCGCKVRAISSGDAAQLLTRLQLDSKRGVELADVVIGLDQNTLGAAKDWIRPWEGWVPRGYDRLLPMTKLGSGFLPLDFGHFALIADMRALDEKKLKPPGSLLDVLKPEWRRGIIFEDPRTSTPGLAFLLYTHFMLGDGAWDFWKQLKTQWLTLTPGWDTAYGLFLRNEAPLVWSYTTSQAYHEEQGDKSGGERRYRAILFKEGQPIQVEGAALLKKAKGSASELKLAQAFMEFLISPEVQVQIPKTNWMWPALKGVKVPLSFEHLPKPKESRHISPVSREEIAALLLKWSQTVEGNP